MKIALDKNNHSDFKVVEKNRLPGRAYFIPQSTLSRAKKTAQDEERYQSDMVTVLSGEWDFKYYSKKSKLPAVLDTARLHFDKITLPATWQRTGYEPPVYLNCPYGFDQKGLRVGELPKDFSCGVYRKFIEITDPDKEYILTFLGASPAIDLYVNGEFVGYGECSHNSYEFDLTGRLSAGKNEIVAVLFKWATGSYLEAQDMFRENGIFRDVLLTAYDKTFLYDYEVKTPKKGETYDLNLKAAVYGDCDGCTVEAALFDGTKKLASASADASAETKISLSSLKVVEWNAELPKLYELFITLRKGKNELMTIRSFVGFKTIEIKGTTFFFNGKKIKLKGVNHHDTHETKGYAMNYDDLEKDVHLMKQYNVNCVRTSHYPPDPHFLELCDRYGLYVLDEADIETHGLCHLGYSINKISNDLKWANRYVDRVSRMYYRDRSHACILMWSLGNEAGGIACHDKCYEFIKSVCPEIPVHYESASRVKRAHYDVYSEMYTHPDDLIKIRDRKRGQKFNEVPFYLCEYCHAMGVGPGALEEYFRIFNSDDIFLGGCIWEWADHSVRHVDDGFPYEYTYGGDHGEKLHDGNFCVDGLFYPDRTPHSGALEMKAVYRPLRVTRLSGDELTILNTNRFRASDDVTVRWLLSFNGEKVKEGKFKTDIAPESEKTYQLSLPQIPDDINVYLDVIYLDGDFEIAREQLTLNEAPFKLPGLVPGKVNVTSDGEILTVVFDGGKAEFSEQTGEMLTYRKNGVSVLNEKAIEHTGFLLNFARAYLDNDNDRSECEKHHLSSPKIELQEIAADVAGGAAAVCEYFSVFGAKDEIFDASVIYVVGANGAIDIEVSVLASEHSREHVSALPRLGLTFEADPRFDTVEYFGRGKQECLPDFKAQSPVGLYQSAVADMTEPYIRPQDNGNHCDTAFVRLTDKKGDSILIYSDRRFTFNVHDYTQASLFRAKHREDLKKEKTTFVTLDGYTRGTGTGSCGPCTLPQYRINLDDELTFGFTIVPEKGE